ncbi:putative bifunctional diguanylate cyclase/phosphodiesterase [Duganella callida]|nr:EAL domain-containing protein [Duganella callida]
MRILIVSADAAERRRMQRLLRSAPGDEDQISCHGVAALDELPRLAGDVPELILLNPHLTDDAEGDIWRILSAYYHTVPIVVLACDSTLMQARQAVVRGAVTHVLSATIGREPLRQMLRAVVIATRRAGADAGAHHQYRAVTEAMADGVLTTDARGCIDYANPAALRLLNASAPDVQGTPIGQLMALRDAETQVQIEHPVLRVLATGGVVRLSGGCVLTRQGDPDIMIQDATSPIRDSAGAVSGVVMTFHDITSAHALKQQVDHLAWHDFLTGLPNRFAAQRHLEQILAEAKVRAVPLAVMYLDLDKFKAVNDHHGHAAGDALLISVTTRLRACFRSIDLISRQGGDEFLVLMAPGSARIDATQAAERIHDAIARPHQVDGTEVKVGCSIGIALFPEHGNCGDALLRHADTALQAAKVEGRNTWRFFSRSLLANVVERRQMEDGMRRAMCEGEFELHYQPKIRLSDGTLCGCEALLRWQHPDWGWVAPGRFIRSAEECGLIVTLGRWVMREALAQARLWQNSGLRFGAIAINVSTLELAQVDFADYLEHQIDVSGLAASRLQLELTESAMMHDMRGAGGVLQRLKDTGLSLAIDDFGTGYSSLSYLAELPIDLLKVDRSFVHGIDHADTRRQTLLRAVLALVDNLGLSAVAEGIETSAEMTFLADAGCGQGQGYYYSQALDACSFERRFLAPPQ